jgi:type I restriction enzyme S subunit
MDDFMTTIGEIAAIFDGPHATPVKTEDGPIFLSISSLESGRLDLSKSARLSDKDFEKWTKRVTPQKGDLLFSYETRLGEAALMPAGIKACLGRRMGLLRPRSEKIVPEYLLYAYLSPAFQQTIVANTITGATVDRIALNEMSKFPIRVPELDEQKKVAELLENIDAKIDCNNRINAELEAMAKTLYDYWFVQFDFPDENGKPYKSSGGKMVYNATLKREIPDGWKVGALGQWLTFKRGISYKSSEVGDEGVPLINLNSFYLDGSIKISGTKRYSGKFRNEQRIEPGELVIAITDVTRNADIVGKAFVVPDLFDEYPLISCDVAAISGGSHLPAYYLERLFNSEEYHRYIRHFASGTLVLHLNLSGVEWFESFLPPEWLVQKYCKFAETARDKITANLKQNLELAQLRDWLLPMLMNGQVSVE